MFTKEYAEKMLSAYLQCGLWSQSCNGTAVEFHDCSGEDCDVSLEHIGFGEFDIEAETLVECRKDCAAFLASVSEEFDPVEIMDSPWNDPAQMGHDFWLTRNGHGTGFWDRGAGELGQRLTDYASPYGDYTFYVEHGEVYGQ